MKFTFLLFICFIGKLGFTQIDDTDKAELYKNYREDQFYASVTYNLLNNKPDDISQSGFSSGFHFGFIRDMPINEKRNRAIGLGLGISTNSYNQKNLFIEEFNDEISLSIINEDDFNVSKNKFTTYLIEVPFEFRWRTSTATDYNFWRIYTGFKVGYLLYNSAKFKSEEINMNLNNLSGFNKIQYGLTLSAGYGTWNFQVYYGLNTIFEDGTKLNDKTVDLKSLKIGLLFYIL
jgi:hypothetical protein